MLRKKCNDTNFFMLFHLIFQELLIIVITDNLHVFKSKHTYSVTSNCKSSIVKQKERD